MTRETLGSMEALQMRVLLCLYGTETHTVHRADTQLCPPLLEH